MALKIKLHSHCQTLRILFASSYVVYVSIKIHPSYSGFMSMVNDPPKSLTKIVYYPVIQRLIIEYSTVKEVLRYSKEASNEFRKSIVITTFDLGVCMKAFPLVWNSQEKSKNLIIVIGTLQLIMAYFKMIGKKYLDLVLVMFFCCSLRNLYETSQIQRW